MGLASGIGQPASLEASLTNTNCLSNIGCGCRPEGGRSPLYEAAWEAAQHPQPARSGVYPPVQRTVSVRPSDRLWLGPACDAPADSLPTAATLAD